MTIPDEWGADIPRDPAAGPPPVMFHKTLPAFVEQVIAVNYRRDVADGELTWCPEWWKHTEAISRLDALWRAWEHLRLDSATGISVWFLMHADPHMAVLLDKQHGPFHGCSAKKGHRERTAPLPCTPPPAGVF